MYDYHSHDQLKLQPKFPSENFISNYHPAMYLTTNQLTFLYFMEETVLFIL
jgi:hypothetical protein